MDRDLYQKLSKEINDHHNESKQKEKELSELYETIQIKRNQLMKMISVGERYKYNQNIVEIIRIADNLVHTRIIQGIRKTALGDIIVPERLDVSFASEEGIG